MNKIVFAAAATIIALSSNASFAENPYVGQPEALAFQDKAARAPGNSPISVKLDFRAPASIGKDAAVYHDGSAHRFGDASPSSYE
ncbi:hypothetical protein O206_15480 [Ochrobactrum sp. EGD-AQ16]|nr:hypothetical protein O206_15480 [Ochrobactrum sp. EGD-AQ16]